MLHPTDIHTHRKSDGSFRTIATAGIHPYDADSADSSTIATIERMVGEIDAIGEIGLDGTCKSDIAQQERVFRAQLAIAERHKKAVVLHTVRRFEQTMKILAEFELPQVIFHGFIGSKEQALRAISCGYYLSFGERTLRSPKTVEALRNAPLDCIFIESDVSDMPLEEIYEKLAALLGIESDKLIKIVAENFERLFPTNGTLSAMTDAISESKN
ncbi:MAG: TatD family hydrolase [Alistipes sp.]|nr:TatD family hydrolase [Alistipes sp.]